jgi:hypothetical protein
MTPTDDILEAYQRQQKWRVTRRRGYETIALIAISIPVRSYVMMCLWNWFAPPPLQPISWAHALGILVLAKFTFDKYVKDKEITQADPFGSRLAHVIMSPIIAYNVGYVIKHYFMGG